MGQVAAVGGQPRLQVTLEPEQQPETGCQPRQRRSCSTCPATRALWSPLVVTSPTPHARYERR
jgi:hypothetical protein